MLKTLFQCCIYMFVKKLKKLKYEKDGCIKLKITFKITLPEIMICLLHYMKKLHLILSTQWK